jgi:hypothetical protein
LREEILQGLGWEILRVWSTDWFDNPNLQTEKLCKQLEELRSKPLAAHEEYRIASSQHAESLLVAEGAPLSIGQDSIVVHQSSGDGSGLERGGLDTVEPSDDQISEAVSKHRAVWPLDELLSSTGTLNEHDLHQVLQYFRETVIAAEMTDWERHRSILRDGMINTHCSANSRPRRLVQKGSSISEVGD